jgi:hypothetical protein
VLTVRYRAIATMTGATTIFASPLVLSVDKGKFTSVVFVENGKEAGRGDFPK